MLQSFPTTRLRRSGIIFLPAGQDNGRRLLAFAAAMIVFAGQGGRLAAAHPQDGPVSTAPFSGGALDIGGRAQLFTDPMLVWRQQRVSFTVHQAQKHASNPVMTANRPWEGWFVRVLGGSVLFDEQEHLFKCWYLCPDRAVKGESRVCYAFSRDGLHWEKPPVGTIEVPGITGHNAVADGLSNASVIKDADDPDPARRYKMIGHSKFPDGTAGGCLLVSPDGLHWTRAQAAPIFPSGDVLTATHDRDRGLYVAFAKIIGRFRETNRRSFAVRTSPDALHWTDPEPAFIPDLRDDAGTLAKIARVRPLLGAPDNPRLLRTEIYGVGSYQAECGTVAFPWMFSIDNDHPVTGNNDGTSEIQLAFARAPGGSWDRSFRAPVLEPGPVGSWDGGFITTASEAFRHDDKVWLYYTGQSYTHADPAAKKDPGPGSPKVRAIGLATWPLDRFVSADAGTDGGTLTTIPLRFSGDRLVLNVNAAGGEVRVEMLDEAGIPVANIGLSDPTTTDALRATVSWSGQPAVGALAGRTVMLRFHLRNASLYSFAFRPLSNSHAD